MINVDLSIVEGVVYGLMGFNGVGKIILICMLAIVEEFIKGEIYLFGDCLVVGVDNLCIK